MSHARALKVFDAEKISQYSNKNSRIRMNSLEKKEAVKFAKVLRASRKMRGINQQDLATSLGISQSLLSKLENALIIPSAPTWFYLCEFLGIHSDSGVKGFIDGRRDASISHLNQIGNFKIPRKYAYLQGSVTRTSRPLLHFFARYFDPQKTKEFIESKKVDPDYFVILDNPININFNLDIIRHLIQSGHLKKHNIHEITSTMQDSSIHGNLLHDYSEMTNSDELLKALERNIAKYDQNWKYRFHRSKKDLYEIEITPYPHLGEFDFETGSIDEFVRDYRKHFIRSFLSDYKVKTKNVDIIEEGKERCICQIQLAQ
jgi:transcriptional regulator with XRE-family HTH domain